MASTSSASKPIQRILDSTKVAILSNFSKFVRRPPVDPNQPIQGRPRETSSNAFKEYVKRESVRLQKALNSISHGKHIFVYHNVRTKQVVYSLTRYLEVSLPLSFNPAMPLHRSALRISSTGPSLNPANV